MLKCRGLDCPRDVPVPGFNDMAFADRFDPPLTSVRIPHRVMEAEARRSKSSGACGEGPFASSCAITTARTQPG